MDFRNVKSILDDEYASVIFHTDDEDRNYESVDMVL